MITDETNEEKGGIPCYSRCNDSADAFYRFADYR
jgi:hypothetical protein